MFNMPLMDFNSQTQDDIPFIEKSIGNPNSMAIENYAKFWAW
jgi:hypothetical protein